MGGVQLHGRPKGLLQNSTNLCFSVNRAVAKFTAQNGRRITLEPALQTACASRAKKHKHGKGGKHTH